MSGGILSLCTGYGGLDLAVEAVTGARTVAVSDLDKGANKILAHRFPTIPNLGDLKTIDWAAWAGTEVMTAGYPCQPFSHAGKREGTDDPRHIFPYIADGIRIVGPRLVVLENVRGHLALGFDTVLGTLADIGYDARWVCVRASDVGAPHRRERLFIVATPNAGRGQLAGSAVEVDGLRLASELGRGSVADAGGERHGRREDGRGLGGLDGAHESGARERQRSREVTVDRSPETPTDTGSLGRVRGQGFLGDGRSTRLGSEAGDHAGHGGVAPTPADAYRDGLQGAGWFRAVGHHADGRDGAGEVVTNWGVYEPVIQRWTALLGRTPPAPTEPGAKGQPRLSPRFVEFMMGLPAGWVTDVPDLTRNEQLKALGNGVVPQQAAAALTFLLNAQEVAA